MEAVITPRDRLSFALFLVISLHAAVILGVGFVWDAQRSQSPTIEVTLAQHNDPEAPETADFIAQSNQLGSGTETDITETTTTQSAEFFDNQVNEVFAETVIPLEAIEAQPEKAQVATVSASETQTSAQNPTPEITETTPSLQHERLLNLSQEIASLEARLDDEQRLDARQPRVRRLTSVSAKRAVDAYYLQAWRRKVEAVGNLNYPEEARTRKLYGSLRLLVSITPDGGLKDVRVLDSSGHKVLDDAAVRIVQLAAPYAPFPEEMRKTTDVLEIIRTWQFRKNRFSRT
jgi:protein TonB